MQDKHSGACGQTDPCQILEEPEVTGFQGPDEHLRTPPRLAWTLSVHIPEGLLMVQWTAPRVGRLEWSSEVVEVVDVAKELFEVVDLVVDTIHIRMIDDRLLSAPSSSTWLLACSRQASGTGAPNAKDNLDCLRCANHRETIFMRTSEMMYCAL